MGAAGGGGWRWGRSWKLGKGVVGESSLAGRVRGGCGMGEARLVRGVGGYWASWGWWWRKIERRGGVFGWGDKVQIW